MEIFLQSIGVEGATMNKIRSNFALFVFGAGKLRGNDVQFVRIINFLLGNSYFLWKGMGALRVAKILHTGVAS